MKLFPHAAALAVFLLIGPGATGAPVVLNEFNAVSSTSFLDGGVGDARFGPVAGNGGDWFELVVTGTGAGSTVDMRGWRIETARNAPDPFVAEDLIVLNSDPFWAAVPAGTILTFTEDRTAEGGMDTTLNATDRLATEGWAHSNIWIGDFSLIAYTDPGINGYSVDPVDGASGFSINDTGTQIRISTGSGQLIFGPAGEGIPPATSGIGNSEVFVLQQAPTTSVTPGSNYGDSTPGLADLAYSTFGRPNRWYTAGTVYDQSFDGLRSGAVPPVFTSGQPNTAIFTGDAFSYAVQAIDGDGDPLALSMVQGPAFLTLTDNGGGSGTLAGTPTAAQAGTHIVELEVTDNDDGTHRQAFVLTVLPVTSPLVVNEYNAVASSNILAQPWSFDQRFGLVKGNGDDWIELVVVGDGLPGSTVDLRGWRLEIEENELPAGRIVLSNDTFWQSVPAGTILTFTESDTAGGGWDTSLVAEDRRATEGWAWSNIYIQDGALIDLVQSAPDIAIVGVETRITIFDGTGLVAAGPYGEGVFSAGTVNNAEVFRLAADPGPGSHPLTAAFSDADTSTFGHPNRLPEHDGTVLPAGSGTGYQLFTAFATGTPNAAPWFTNLWGTRFTNTVLPGGTWSTTASPAQDPDDLPSALTIVFDQSPAGSSLVNHGDGSFTMSWTPTAPQAGRHEFVVTVSDPGGASFSRSFILDVIPVTSPVLVNEFNAVSGSRFLNNGTALEDADGGMAADVFFGRVAGNGGDWFELMVVGDGTAGSTVDMRGWQIDIANIGLPTETIVLSQHPYFATVQAGTILTFVQRDSLDGGLDSTIHRVNRFADLGYAWTNIALNDPAFVDQAASTFGTGITLNDEGSEITLKDSTGLTLHGPAGEPLIERNVSGAEVFNLEANPAPDINPSPMHPDYPLYGDDGASSTFGAPNEWDDGGSLEMQDLGNYATTANTNSLPYFSTLPAGRYGRIGTTTSQPVQAADFDGDAGLALSLVSSPGWVSLVDNGNGAGVLSWTPPAGTVGFHTLTLRVSDGTGTFDRPVTIFVQPAPAPVVLNEYNAVSSSNFLNGGTVTADNSGGTASDVHFGRVTGNGGDWFELVVVGNDDTGTLDIRGWKIEVATDADFPFGPESVLELSNDPRWAAVPHGTILTFTEERTSEGGMDTSLDVIDRSATDGWSWSNFWIGDPQYLTYTSPLVNGYTIDPGTGTIAQFDITGDRTQFVIRDAAGNHLYGPAGEGVAPAGGINNRNVWELVDHPRSTVNPLATADLLGPEFGAAPSALESTFGRPNTWNGGSEVQDFLVFSGPYGNYVTAAGLSGAAALIDADGDGDGVTNGEEFAHGSDPGDPLSQPRFLPGVTTSLGVTFLLRSGGTIVGDTYLVDGIGIIVEYSTNLRDWSPTSIGTSNPPGLPAPPPGYTYVTIQMPTAVFNASDMGFLRVVTVVP